MNKKVKTVLGPFILVVLLSISRYLFSSKMTFITEIAIYSLFVMGNNILYGYLGMVSFGQPFYLSIGAWTSAIFLAYIGHNPILAMLLGIAGGVITGFVLGPFFIRLRGDYFALINAALCAIGVFVFQKLLIGITRGEDGLWFRTQMSRVRLLDIRLPNNFFFFVMIIFFIVLVLYSHMNNSVLGSSFKALKVNERKMRFLGFDTFRIRWIGFILASALSSLSGSLYALNLGFVNPSLGETHRAAEVLVATLLGGSGTVYGPFFGALGFLGIKDLVSRWVTRWELVVGVITLIVMFRFSKGIWGGIRKVSLKIYDRDERSAGRCGRQRS
ncbi:MAG: branched-chain amino acid ABC transporter permease [Spirochaetes bacterium]|nr:branched-chain amino acid ABC transporter permease [Spirochaetota bacterium]